MIVGSGVTLFVGDIETTGGSLNVGLMVLYNTEHRCWWYDSFHTSLELSSRVLVLVTVTPRAELDVEGTIRLEVLLRNHKPVESDSGVVTLNLSESSVIPSDHD